MRYFLSSEISPYPSGLYILRPGQERFGAALRLKQALGVVDGSPIAHSADTNYRETGMMMSTPQTTEKPEKQIVRYWYDILRVYSRRHSTYEADRLPAAARHCRAL